MTVFASAVTIRWAARPELGARARMIALLAACAVLDAVAAGMLLLGTPFLPPIEALAIVVSHGASVWLTAHAARSLPGRRWLGVAAMITVPFIGAAIAAAAHLAGGRGTLVMRRRRSRPRQVLTIASIRSVGSALSPCDALVRGNEEQRRGALSRLSRRADADAIALLRRSAVGRDPDLALSAALVLDEIRERLERVVDHPSSAELRHVSD